MSLIRRVAPQGRANIGKRLMWIRTRYRLERQSTVPFSKRWSAFLDSLWILLDPPRGSLGLVLDDDAVAEAYLAANLSDSPADALLPWLWREMSTHNEDWRRFRHEDYGRVRDWFLGVRPRPNIMALDLSGALRAANAWHDNLAIRRLAQDITQTFPTVVAAGAGWEWRKLSPISSTFMPLRAVGRALGHCYQHPNTASHYVTNYKMYVLLVKGQPVVMAAINSRRMEILGARNEEPAETYWPAIIQLLLKVAADPAHDWGVWQHRTPKYLAQMEDLASRWERDPAARAVFAVIDTLALPPRLRVEQAKAQAAAAGQLPVPPPRTCRR